MGAIEVTDLAVSYGELKAVDGVSFEVAEGEFFGILGPNGAGKTTTLEIIEGLRKPDSGPSGCSGSPWPRNPRPAPRIGVQLQASSFFERLTAREQIRTFASLYGVPPAAADEWLERVGLIDKADTRAENSPAASRSGCPSRARSSTTRSCCSSTSRRRRSTRRRGATSGTCSPASTTAAARWC